MTNEHLNVGFTHESTHNQTTEWYTPKTFFDRLRVRFDLDPCSPGKEKVPWIPARKHYRIKDDGLLQPWLGRVWLNPPYGSQTARWLKKLSRHGNGIALVFARTDTQWFHRYATKASLICFLEGRVRFIKSDGTKGGTPGCGSMLLAYGDKCAEVVSKSGLGWFIDNRKLKVI